jgi:hypothetical protein
MTASCPHEENRCEDTDGDGFGAPASESCFFAQADCDDAAVAVNPGAPEICGNDVDEDCDGLAQTCAADGDADADLDAEQDAAPDADPDDDPDDDADADEETFELGWVGWMVVGDRTVVVDGLGHWVSIELDAMADSADGPTAILTLNRGTPHEQEAFLANGESRATSDGYFEITVVGVEADPDVDCPSPEVCRTQLRVDAP